MAGILDRFMNKFRPRSAIFRLPLPALLWWLTSFVPAAAHSGEGGFVLLLPTGYYLAGGTLAVLVSFLLVFLIPAVTVARWGGARLPLGEIPLPPVMLTSTLSAVILLGLLIAGFCGSADPRINPLPVAIWSLWWVGFTFLQAVCGDLWHRLNPWMAPYRLLMRVMGRHQPWRSYPDWLGYWPAILGFLGFAWFELVDLAPNDPTRLAVAILVYAAITLTGMLLFGGEAWLHRADPFSVFLRLIAHLSPIDAEPIAPNRCRLSLVLPGTRLFSLQPLPISGVLFVLLTLSAVSFDGLCRTFWWLAKGGINPLEFPGRSAVSSLNTAGLLGLWLALAATYLIAIALGRWINPAMPAARAAGILVVSIIPISLAYHFAHYLTVLLVDLQYAALALSDPFGRGWNLFGLDSRNVTMSFLNNYHSVVMIWNLQAGAIVLGHILAVAVAHVLSARLGGDGWRAPFAQMPLAALMVLYTLFGLWLLAAPNAG